MENTKELEKLCQARKNTRHSGFGIILDCSRGYSSKLTQIKIIDISINPKLPGGNNFFDLKNSSTIQSSSSNSSYTYANMLIFWKNNPAQNIFVQKIGDIIRFHNFDFSIYNNTQLQAKNGQTGSWELYSIDQGDPYVPYAKGVTDQESNVIDDDKEFLQLRLDRLRKWSNEFFGKTSLKELNWYSLERVQPDTPNSSFDMLVRIDNIDQKMNNITWLDVTGDDLIQYQIFFPSNEIGIAKVGDIAKLRSIEKIQQKLLIPQTKYQAILPLPKNFLDVKKFGQENSNSKDKGNKNSTIEDKPGNYGLIPENSTVLVGKTLNSTGINSHAIKPETQEDCYKGYTIEKAKKKVRGMVEIIEGSTILNCYKGLQTTNMFDLIKGVTDQNLKQLFKNSERIRIQGQIWDIAPKNLIDAVRLECRVCGLLRRINSDAGNICCKQEMKKIWFIKLLLKDGGLRNRREFCVVWLFSTHNDNPKYIFQSLKLDNLDISNINEYDKKYKAIIQSLLNSSKVYDLLLSYLDCGVETLEGQLPFKVVDTVFLEDEE